MKFICVAGMHRSGTSATTKVLGILGAQLGRRREMIAPGEENPRGFWEIARITRFNNHLLSDLGGSWDHPPIITREWLDSGPAGRWIDDAGEAVGAVKQSLSDRSNTAFLAVKDPRFCLLLPFWRRVLTWEHVVVPIRRPHAVAASLAARNGMDADHAVYLWLRYLSSVLTAAPDAILVFYEDLLADPRGQATKLGAEIGLPAPSERQLAEVEEFLTLDLDRSGDAAPVAGPLGELAESLYDRLRSGDRAAVDLARDLELFGSTLGVDLEEFGAQRAQETHSTAALPDGLAEAREQIIRDRREMAFHSARALRMEFDRDLAVTRASRAEAREEKERLRREDLRRRLDERNAELEAVRHERDQALAELEALRGRRAVRLALQAVRPLTPVVSLRRSLRRADGDAEPLTLPAPAPTREPADDQTRERMPAVRPTIQPADVGTLDVEALLGHRNVPVTVLVPVFNAFEETQACLESVLTHTRYPFHLVVIDDASTDERIAPYLAGLADHPHVTVLTNEQNLGFTGTVNRGLEHAPGDVVLLNSDAKVGPMWLRTLVMTAYAAPDRGTVTAVSNNAGAFSVPVRGEDNPLPAAVSFEEVARRMAQEGEPRVAWSPTGNGFCMFIRRAVVDQVGGLDAENFPRGYGEENDFSMRARAAGWQSVVSGRVLAYHGGSKSFGDEREELIASGVARVKEIHPEYADLVPQFLKSEEMARIRERAAAVFTTARPARPRVLHLSHAGSGGVPRFLADVTLGSADFDHYVLRSDGNRLILSSVSGSHEEELDRVTLTDPVDFLQVEHREYAAHLLHWVDRYGIEAAHVQHLIGHPLGALEVLAAVGVRSTMTLHDYYLVCPTIQLLDSSRNFCGGTCHLNGERCLPVYPWIKNSPQLPVFEQEGVLGWRRRVATHVLPHADVLVAPVQFVRDTFVRTYPDLESRIVVSPHGTDIVRRTPASARTAVEAVEGPAKRPERDRPLRCLALGNLNYQKGVAVLGAVLKLDTENLIELHILGSVPSTFVARAHFHGTYTVDEVVERIHEIDPDVVIIPTLWGETFCYTLSEAWAAGMPTVVADVGALRERLQQTGAGWTVPARDAKALYELLLRLREHPEERDDKADKAREVELRSVASMAASYSDCYRKTMTAPWQDLAGTASRISAGGSA